MAFKKLLHYFRLTFVLLFLLFVGVFFRVLFFVNSQADFDKIILRFEDSGFAQIEFSPEGIAVLQLANQTRIQSSFDVVPVKKALHKFRQLRDETTPYDYHISVTDGEGTQMCTMSSQNLSTKTLLLMDLGFKDFLFLQKPSEDVTFTFATKLIQSIPAKERVLFSESIRGLRSQNPYILRWVQEPSREWPREPHANVLCTPQPWVEEYRIESPDGEIDAVVVSREGPPFGQDAFQEYSSKQISVYLLLSGLSPEDEKPYLFRDFDKYLEKVRKQTVFMGLDVNDVEVSWQDGSTLLVRLDNSSLVFHNKNSELVTKKNGEERVVLICFYIEE